jgi:putative ABC transport system permease protein
MWFLRQFPLAWRILSDRPGRFVFSVVGVAFAVVVMFTELGFLNGITDSSCNVAGILDCDLVIAHPHQEHLKSYVQFSAYNLRQVNDVPGVAHALPLYFAADNWANPQDGSRNRVLVLGVDLSDPMLRVPALAQHLEALKQPGAVLFDRRARIELGDVKESTRTLLDGRPVRVVGLFDLGPNFAYEGNIIMGTENFVEMPGQNRDTVDLGLVRLLPGQDPEVVRQRIREKLHGLVDVLTPREVFLREKRYTTDHAPIGIVFGLGLLVGFAIGVVVCYQILFNEVSDHLPQFAMIKAIGHLPRFLTALVLLEALILSIGGYLAGLATALFLYAFMEEGTALRMIMTPPRALLVLALSSGMCLIAGRLALKKVNSADPADLF